MIAYKQRIVIVYEIIEHCCRWLIIRRTGFDHHDDVSNAVELILRLDNCCWHTLSYEIHGRITWINSFIVYYYYDWPMAERRFERHLHLKNAMYILYWWWFANRNNKNVLQNTISFLNEIKFCVILGTINYPNLFIYKWRLILQRHTNSSNYNDVKVSVRTLSSRSPSSERVSLDEIFYFKNGYINVSYLLLAHHIFFLLQPVFGIITNLKC